MRVGTALSTNANSLEAAEEALGRALSSLQGEPPQLTVLFFSVHHLPLIDQIAEIAAKAAAPGTLLGCTAQAVVGDGREVEEGPALSVWTAHLGEAVIEPFTVAIAETEDGPATLGLPAIDGGTKAVILLGDPYTFPGNVLDEFSAGSAVPIIGGMASGGRGPGSHALVLDGEVRSFGAVGVTLGGDLRIETLVSQGCRPIGSSFIVTAAEGNVIHALAGMPPLERLRNLFGELSPEDQQRANRGLHIGVVIDEYATDFGPGDFLIRNVIGVDQNTGAIAVGDEVHVGQTVQFHIRDASSADEDLRSALGVLELSLSGDPNAIAGALMFTCNGRGLHLFGTPDHDVESVRRALGPLPVAGMFCAGEIGPVGGKNFLHGFTASLALFAAGPGAGSPGVIGPPA
jgi:small ligand-binding sensory domain FIST